MRQSLFLALVAALGAYAYVAACDVRDLATQAASLAPAGGNRVAFLVAESADKLAIVLLAGVGLICFVIMAVAMPIMDATIAKPIRALARQMGELASGNTEIEIVGEKREDEIGTIARALGTLRAEVQRNGALMAEIRARDDREARLVREAAIRDGVEHFSGELTGLTGRLGGMTRQMAEDAETMIAAVRHANEGSASAKTAAGDAAGDVAAVASAAEQLLDAIEEISRQVVDSTGVVREAVAETQKSSSGMDRLATAASRVGAVVELISRIAAQTNLLALNATIEAARAGDAGRGFAVVAQEVKTLATRTAKATQDIAEQIAEMQAATEQSVGAIEAIKSRINAVERISAIIASAVHEQGASTQEIVRSTRSAAEGTSAMSEHVGKVAAAVADTGDSVESVVKLAHELDALAARMRDNAGDFSAVLKSAEG